MSERINKVALVLDPDYGAKLTSLAEAAHVWVIDTPANRAVTSKNRTYDCGSGITTFKSADNASRLKSCLNILPMIDLHHGRHSCNPPYSVLDVIGVPLNANAKRAIKDLGFERFETTVEGFRATRII
ncbi:MAG TPA: hypothetical protein VFI24_15145 [Pyrinomonadaceae bacterium]|nr:hypothetical protein [Pyrinomonadaceae bacterium]